MNKNLIFKFKLKLSIIISVRQLLIHKTLNWEYIFEILLELRKQNTHNLRRIQRKMEVKILISQRKLLVYECILCS